MRADQPRVEPFDIVETRPPHKRAITEHPEVAGGGDKQSVSETAAPAGVLLGAGPRPPDSIVVNRVMLRNVSADDAAIRNLHSGRQFGRAGRYDRPVALFPCKRLIQRLERRRPCAGRKRSWPRA